MNVNAPSQKLYGTFFGVYLPGLLSMFGIVIYLRFAWIIGTLGLPQTLSVVSLSTLIVFITVLSIASAATNMHVGNGGTYYMVSRSLGIEMGAAVGIPLFLAQTLTISFCAMGFAETIQPFFPDISLHYLGAATVIGLMLMVFISSAIAIKTQLIVFLVILASFVSLFMGKNFCPTGECTLSSGLIGTSFWAGFALFFPATTGVESGVSMSGNLRSSRRSLPLGTIAVLITGFIVYMTIPFFLWTHAPRESLINDPLIFQHIARFKYLVVAGIWAAALSTVVSGLLAAPRTLQALAQDKIFPKFLAKEWGKDKEPRIATLCCFAIAILGVFYGSVDKIAPILTMFYLIAYTTLNLATGLEGLIGNPSFRPTFKIHWTVSLIGAFLCILAMFMITPGYTFIALFFVAVIYLFMKKRNFASQWEDIGHGLLLFLSRFAIYKLAHKEISPRSWRPHFLIFSDSPVQNHHLIHAASAIGKGKGFLTLATVFTSNLIDPNRAERWKKIVCNHLKEKKVEALVEFCIDDSLVNGAKKLLGNYGMGLISPNTLVIGEMTNRETSKEYISILKEACMAKKNVLIIKDQNTFGNISNKIHVWWDDASRSNSELMLLLSHMLQTHKHHKKAKLHLNTILANAAGVEQRLQYFYDFFAKGRFAFTPNVHTKEKDDSPWKIMSEVSADADIVFIGINAPRIDQTHEEYEEYYFSLINNASRIPNAVFVICAEDVKFGEIFH